LPFNWWINNRERQQEALSRIPQIRETARFRAESVKELIDKRLMHLESEINALKLEIEKIKKDFEIPEELKRTWKERETKAKLPI